MKYNIVCKPLPHDHEKIYIRDCTQKNRIVFECVLLSYRTDIRVDIDEFGILSNCNTEPKGESLNAFLTKIRKTLVYWCREFNDHDDDYLTAIVDGMDTPDSMYKKLYWVEETHRWNVDENIPIMA